MKIALAQLNYTIGAFEENAGKMIRAIEKAKQQQASLVVFSELAICGYPPLDLLEYRYFVDRCLLYIQKVASACHGIAALVGAPSLNPEPPGKNLFNSAYFLEGGTIRRIFHKTLLPTYDIFDEYRYFEPNGTFSLLECEGCRIAVTICEDLWYKQPILTGFGKDRLYPVCPMDELKPLQPDLVINMAASPFSWQHDTIKAGILAENAVKYGLPLLYVNQVGAHCELIFDGGSMVIGREGRRLLRLNLFGEDFAVVDTNDLTVTGTIKDWPASPRAAQDESAIALIHDALVLGIRDYFGKTGLKTAVLGLSGGIDSAVTLVLACNALGSGNLHALLLPSQYSSDHSVRDAIHLAENLGVSYHIISIGNIFDSFRSSLHPLFKDLPEDITEENIQARIRGNLLMAFSNKFGHILLNTSNKSEAAVGYGTLYGDMSGGLSVLGDVYKTDVYRLAAYINRDREIIPRSSILKAPSAELRPGQKDSDSLPEYEVLDRILYNYVECKKSVGEMTDQGFDRNLVEKIVRMVNRFEYKRFQAPPVLRISSKSFGFGRRMPVVASY